MIRRNFLGLTGLGAMSSLLLQSATPTNSGFAPVNGLRLYYEFTGTASL
jgi:hypothetical protein